MGTSTAATGTTAPHAGEPVQGKKQSSHSTGELTIAIIKISFFFAAAAARFGPRKDEFPFVIVNESFCVRILKLGSYVF